jgi:hypothetical protein
MGFFGKSELPEDIIQVAPDADVEKTTVPAHVEKPPTATIEIAAIDPELERRVVRKLDLRVPTLMGFFCMVFQAPKNIAEKVAGQLKVGANLYSAF